MRVSDRDAAVRFHDKLGFKVDAANSNLRVAEVMADSGLRLNLIFNGERRSGSSNILLDEERKWCGYTHAAFVVPSLREVLTLADSEKIPITEGPVYWGRRITCFLRDPDGNVLEFNELKP